MVTGLSWVSDVERYIIAATATTATTCYVLCVDITAVALVALVTSDFCFWSIFLDENGLWMGQVECCKIVIATIMFHNGLVPNFLALGLFAVEEPFL